MDFDDYAELRRRAERRLTVFSIWPLLLFQLVAYTLNVLRNPLDLAVPLLIVLAALGFMIWSVLRYRRRTAANRVVRRAAIDESLQEMVDTGWPLQDPSARELRLLASLLDDDLEARAGTGRAVVLASIVAATLQWPLVFFYAGSRSYYTNMSDLTTFFFLLWLIVFGALLFVQARRRKIAGRRVRSALSRAGVWNPAKPKRSAEAPWWSEDDEVEKPKRLLMEEEEVLRMDDDGELPSRRLSRGEP
jgi:hypothetical protein